MEMREIMMLLEYKAFIEYKDPYERYNVYLMLDTHRYVAYGLGEYKEKIPFKPYWNVDDAIEHAETVLGDYDKYQTENKQPGDSDVSAHMRKIMDSLGGQEMSQSQRAMGLVSDQFMDHLGQAVADLHDEGYEMEDIVELIANWARQQAASL